jgi:mRNA interferase MazF
LGTLTKGTIVLFPFPFTDLTGQKLRPCLVLSNTMDEDILLCQITSKAIKTDNSSIEIKSDETLNGSLSIDSLVRTNMLFSGSIEDIKRVICNLDKNKYNLVCDKIFELIK